MRQETAAKLSSYAHKSEVKEEIESLFEKYLGRDRKSSPAKQRRIDEVSELDNTSITRCVRTHRVRVRVWSKSKGIDFPLITHE